MLLINYLRCIEELYRYLAIIAYNYFQFIFYFINFKQLSCDDILVIQNNKPIEIYNNPSHSKINEILEKIREERILVHNKSGKKENIHKLLLGINILNLEK